LLQIADVDCDYYDDHITLAVAVRNPAESSAVIGSGDLYVTFQDFDGKQLSQLPYRESFPDQYSEYLVIDGGEIGIVKHTTYFDPMITELPEMSTIKCVVGGDAVFLETSELATMIAAPLPPAPAPPVEGTPRQSGRAEASRPSLSAAKGVARTTTHDLTGFPGAIVRHRPGNIRVTVPKAAFRQLAVPQIEELKDHRDALDPSTGNLRELAFTHAGSGHDRRPGWSPGFPWRRGVSCRSRSGRPSR
jgi:hypothetical protein